MFKDKVYLFKDIDLNIYFLLWYMEKYVYKMFLNWWFVIYLIVDRKYFIRYKKFIDVGLFLWVEFLLIKFKLKFCG